MNIADLAALVCETVRKPDTDSLTACKNYLKRRDQMLWDGNLWRDSLFTFTLALDSTQAFNQLTNPILPTSGTVLLPRSIDRVLAVRKAAGALPVQNLERYFMDSLDAFAQTGEPCEFAVESPVVWQFDEPTAVYIYNGVGDDVTITVRYLDADSGEYQSASILVSAAPSVIRPNAYSVPAITEIVEVTKPLGNNNVTFSAGDTAWFAALATETRIEPYQRIRLFPAPTAALTIRALVKKKYSPIGTDYEHPRLRQAENVLIAYATGDMLRRSNKFGMANEAYAEGAALLSKLENIEFFQQAQRMQLVPEIEGNGFGQDVDSMGGTKGYW